VVPSSAGPSTQRISTNAEQTTIAIAECNAPDRCLAADARTALAIDLSLWTAGVWGIADVAVTLLSCVGERERPDRDPVAEISDIRGPGKQVSLGGH
jgi:hypothetical protein